MDFALSEDQRAFQATAAQFAREAMMPHAADWDEEETIGGKAQAYTVTFRHRRNQGRVGGSKP